MTNLDDIHYVVDIGCQNPSYILFDNLEILQQSNVRMYTLFCEIPTMEFAQKIWFATANKQKVLCQVFIKYDINSQHNVIWNMAIKN